MERSTIVNSKIEKLKKEIAEGNIEALNIFWSEVQKEGAPLIEDIQGNNEESLVTIIYREKKPLKNVVLIPPVGMRKLENCVMDKLEGTDLWYISYKVKKDVKFTYQFSPNDPLNNDWERRWKNTEGDQFNKKALNFKGKINDKYNLVPYVVLENCIEEVWTKENDNVPKGKLYKHLIKSETLKEERNISVYVPHSYNEKGEPYGVLVLNDGFEFINILNGINVLDNLIFDKKIPPIVAVFIDATKDRGENLKCSDEFTKFISEEVIGFVKERYNISEDSSKNVIGGYSLGGLAASYTALRYPKIFGNVLSESGSYWYKKEGYDDTKYTWMSNEFRKVEKLPIKFYINVGSIEPAKSMQDTNINLKETLIDLGYKVFFEEFGSGHDYLCWGEYLGRGLIYLLGNQSNN